METKVSCLTTAAPRYESSWYGPWTAILSTIFPPAEAFVVKPQSKIRPELDTTQTLELLSQTGRPSLDSDGGLVAPRGHGREVVGIPDFVVATSDGVTDTPVLIVEIKRLGASTSASVEQLTRYMGAVFRRGRAASVRGLLAAGPEARVYSVSALHPDGEVELDWCSITGTALYYHLKSGGDGPLSPSSWLPPSAGNSASRGWGY